MTQEPQSNITQTTHGIHQQRDIVQIPLSELSLSPANMRKSTQIEPEFVESIKHNGVVQALTIDSLNKVAGGRRRFNALKQLLSKKVIDKDYLVPCVLIDADEAQMASIVENFHRVSPHPCDYYTAIVKLSKDPNLTKKDICTRLQIDSLQYDQYIRLAGLNNKIFKAYAAGVLNDKQAQAFAATDNKKLQLQIWEKSDFDPQIAIYTIKQMINGDLTSDSPLLRFITFDSYKEQSGKFTHDLFSDVFAIHDRELAENIADSKLTAALEEFKAKNPGWRWYSIESVSVTPEITAKSRLQGKYRKITTDQQKSLDDLSQKIEPLDDRRYDDLTSEEEEFLDVLCEQFEALEYKINSERQYFTKTQMKLSGVMISFDDRGNLLIDKGCQTREDIADEKAALKKKSKKQSTDPEASKVEMDALEPSNISNALALDLKLTHRSLVKAELLKYPALATEILSYSLITDALDRYPNKFNSISTRETSDETQTNEYAESKAALILEQAYKALPQEWLDNESDADKFKAYRALKTAEKEQLLAYVSVITITEDVDDIITLETELNPRDYWQPTYSNYLSRISKPQILEHIEELIGKEHRETKESYKKKDLATFAATIFTGGDYTFDSIRQWLPPFFRVK